jgi:malic enzyme
VNAVVEDNISTTRTPAVPGVLDDPMRNHGVAFSLAERQALGLTGRLPAAVLTLEEQAERAYRQLQRQDSDPANALLYPGLGLGTIVARASGVSDGMLLAAAAEAVAGQADVSAPGAALLPAVQNLRTSSATTAVAVAAAAMADGVATSKPDNPVQAVQDAMWQPVYPDAVSGEYPS